MAEPLYALQRDLDMITDEVHNLNRSYNLLDYIAKVVRDCQIEQLAQAAQMRRMEGDIAGLKGDVVELKQDMSSVKEILYLLTKNVDVLTKKVDVLTKNVDVLTKKFALFEKNLDHINRKLGIQLS